MMMMTFVGVHYYSNRFVLVARMIFGMIFDLTMGRILVNMLYEKSWK